MLFLNKKDRIRNEIKGGGYLKNALNLFKTSKSGSEYKEDVNQLGLHNKADIKRFLNKLEVMEKKGRDFIKSVENNKQLGGNKKSNKSRKSRKLKKTKVIKRISKNIKKIGKSKKSNKKRLTKKKKGGNYYFPQQGVVFLANTSNLSKEMKNFNDQIKNVGKKFKYENPDSNYQKVKNSVQNIESIINTSK